MKKVLLLLLFIPLVLVSQSAVKGYSKEIALYEAKFFIISEG
jgi:hypothetical protein